MALLKKLRRLDLGANSLTPELAAAYQEGFGALKIHLHASFDTQVVFNMHNPDEEGLCIHRFRFRQFHNPNAASQRFRVPVYDQGLLAEDDHPLVPILCEIQDC